MSVKMKFGSKDIPFVYKGDKLVYPNPIKDGLLLWYDFKGMRNTDTNKEVAKDLSGNGNDGTLTNFNFTEGSGYKDNTLVFDGVDDNLTIPELELDETAMSVELNGKTYSYDGDKVISVDEEGIVEVGNLNLFKFTELVYPSNSTVSPGVRIEFTNSNYYISNFINLEADTEYYISIDKIHNPNNPLYKDGATIQINNKTNNSVVRSLGRINSGDRLSFSLTQEEIDAQEGVFSVAVYISNSTYISGYIEGVMVTSGASKVYSPAPEDLAVTEIKHSPLSSLQLYNKPLNKTELLHNVGKQSPKELKEGQYVQDGLVLHYDFSHESNISEYKGKAFDYSGNGNHGELQNFNFTEESGYEGGKLNFDGVDDYVGGSGGSSNDDILGINTIHDTVSFTVKANEDKRNNLLYASETLKIDVYGTYIRKADISPNLTTSHDMMTKPVSVSYVRYDGGIKVYIDGELVSDNPYDNEKFKELQLYNIGFYIVDGRPNVELYDVKIYNRPLTAEEIAHNYEIEKERFHDKYIAPTNLPIGQATIGSTFIIGGNKT